MDASLSVARTITAATPATVVAGTLDALLFREVLEPLTAALGPASGVVLDRVVESLFVRRHA